MSVSNGLRERKKLKTRQIVQREALRLFLRQGYEETTVEQIADAAEISSSTFFRYFATKEDIVLTHDYAPLFTAAFERRPETEPLLKKLQRAACETLERILDQDRAELLARLQLVTRAPALQARYWQQHRKRLRLLAEYLGRQTGRNESDFEIRVAAAALFGAIIEAELFWAEHGGKPSLVELIEKAFEQAGDSLKAISGKSAVSRRRK
jgi:AcrR family transcriptional regulator